MLRKLGISKGDVVAMALPNSPEYPIVFFGALALGATVTTINITYTAGKFKAHAHYEERCLLGLKGVRLIRIK